jgi:hypothetical protein
MQVLSLVWGILAVVGMIVAFFPCVGWMNWFNIPFSGVGLIIGIIAITQAPPEKKGMAVAGTVMCGIAVVLGAIRLIMGGGIV